MELKTDRMKSARDRSNVSSRASRLSPNERREQLLACAIKNFAELGFSAANHTTIAAAAGVSVPTVFFYFSTRAALVAAVLDEVEGFYRRTFARAVKDAKPADTTVLDLTEALTSTLGTHADYARILRAWSVSVHDQIWPRYLRHYRRMIAGMAAVIRRGQREGVIRADLNATDEAVILYAGSTALIQMMETGESSERLDRFRRAVVQTVLLPSSPARQNQCSP